MSVPQSALQSKVRKAVPEQRQSASRRSMPELRPVSRNNTVFRFMRHPACRCSGTYRLLSVSFLSGPTAAWANGNTSRFAPASIYSGRSQGGKSPLSVCPADHYSLPAQAVSPVISYFPSAFIPGFPSAFIPGRAVRTVIIGATLCFLRMLSGSHRSGFTAANIGRRACPLRFEVHFLQILP